jgi:phosphohistidine phosphatase
VMVSHQPLIGHLVCHLLNIPEHDMVIKKGAVWWLRYKLKENIPQVTLLTVQSPELL